MFFEVCSVWMFVRDSLFIFMLIKNWYGSIFVRFLGFLDIFSFFGWNFIGTFLLKMFMIFFVFVFVISNYRFDFTIVSCIFFIILVSIFSLTFCVML